MSTHKNIDRICIIAVILSLILSILFMNAEALGIQASASVMGYENRLFNTEKVHTIDIVMDNWDSFIETCENEEYAECSVIIDGESFKNIAIRAKGNTSLSNVSSMDSDRYSFKIEFDHYDSNKTYHGLDKLSLNNLIQDNTLMKDYLTYQMMGQFGVSAPMCSFAYITVNGEDWGLYLAVEGVEDSFLQRNYGNNYGELYKPDSLSFGGGRGNGKDFNLNDFDSRQGKDPSSFFAKELPDMSSFTPSEMQDSDNRQETFIPPDNFRRNEMFGNKGGFGGGMGSSDVKLQYIDDNPDSYSNIFDNAKTDITDSDKERLISALKALSENADIESTVNVDEVIRYFVVHTFVCNGDSYTGSMIHNYYLYEKNGQLSMIPWDYNLAFGTFQGSNASDQVNSPIDSPVSGDTSDRPMISWIFENEKYTELYHEYFAQFLKDVNITEIIDKAADLITPYVEKDPTKFCTYEEFENGVKTLKEFCLLRTESVQGQLDGSIPSTSDEQNQNSSALIDASSINISDMGTMGNGMGGGKDDFNNRNKPTATSNESSYANVNNSLQLQLSESDDNTPAGSFDGGFPNMTDFSDAQDAITPPSMPDNTNGENPVQSETTDNHSEDNFSQTRRQDVNRQNNSFPSSENETLSNSSAFILAGTSIIVLIIGLIIAGVYKR